jgi:glycine cleavage system H protein
MSVPGNLVYTDDHEWILVEGDEVVIGITDYAQGELGDIVDVELQDVDHEFEKGDSIGTIDAVKATSDIYAPVSGVLTAVNDDLPDDPDLLNTDAYGAGWIYRIKISDPSELDDLIGPDEYEEQIGAVG